MLSFADILASAPMNLLAAAAVGAAGGLYLFYRGFRLLQRKRLILNTPASKIRSASMGLVEINGPATGPHAINSPLKQISCYFYRSIAWEFRQRGKNSEWVKVAEESLHVPFYIDDGSGKLLVDPSGAEMDLHCDMHEEYNRSVLLSGPEMPGSVYAFLSRHGVDSSRRIKVEERCISPENHLFILGTLSQNPGLDASVVPAWAGQSAQKSIRLAMPAITPAKQKPEIVNLSVVLSGAGLQSGSVGGRGCKPAGSDPGRIICRSGGRNLGGVARRGWPPKFRSSSSGGADERQSRSHIFYLVAEPA